MSKYPAKGATPMVGLRAAAVMMASLEAVAVVADTIVGTVDAQAPAGAVVAQARATVAGVMTTMMTATGVTIGVNQVPHRTVTITGGTGPALGVGAA